MGGTSGRRQAATLEAELERLRRIPSSSIDEVGYIPFDPDAAALFFALIASRYERASLVVSSNKTFSVWVEIFGDARGRGGHSRPPGPPCRGHPPPRRQLPPQGQDQGGGGGVKVPLNAAVFNRRIPRSFRPALTHGVPAERSDRTTKEPIRRMEMIQAGELIHVDIKK